MLTRPEAGSVVFRIAGAGAFVSFDSGNDLVAPGLQYGHRRDRAAADSIIPALLPKSIESGGC